MKEMTTSSLHPGGKVTVTQLFDTVEDYETHRKFMLSLLDLAEKVRDLELAVDYRRYSSKYADQIRAKLHD